MVKLVHGSLYVNAGGLFHFPQIMQMRAIMQMLSPRSYVNYRY